MEPKFMDFLREDKNWEIEGEDETGSTVSKSVVKKKSLDEECCG
jgi:hypothetical protein